MSQLFGQVNLLSTGIKFWSYYVKTAYYGAKMLSYYGPKIWKLVPPEIKDSETLEILREKIKKSKPDRSPVGSAKLLS